MLKYHRLFFMHLAMYLLMQFKAFSQNDSILLDSRDGQKYPTIELNGDVWMLENLVLKTSLSFGLPDTLKSMNPEFKGRWYHMNELDSICPIGWRLPELDDWIRYFDYLSQTANGSYKLQTSEADYRITEFNQYFDLFENGNPLKILPAGIYEGNQFIYAPSSADFWIMDLKPRKESEKKRFKVVKKSYPGAAHIHLYNQFTHIHSHKHHLDPNNEDELRRFMCRCIKKNEAQELKTQ